MPSEYQKKKLAKKKELAKQKGGKKAAQEDTDESGTATPSQNGTGTATPLETGGTATPSSSNGATSKKKGKKEMEPTKTYEEELCERLEKEADLAAEARACTGSLAIHQMARDIKIANFSVTFHGAELLVDTKLELSVGQR